MWNRSILAAMMAALLSAPMVALHADQEPATDADAAPATPTDTPSDAAVSSEPAPAEPAAEAAPEKAKPTRKGQRVEHADSFVAPANWEFDGFVAGGKDQEVKSMFYLNDLVYLNIGADQGLASGDRVNFFRKGEKVRDPQTGKVMGYEVRRTGLGQVTDHIDQKTCAVRILQANEAVEIGDLVRRQEK